MPDGELPVVGVGPRSRADAVRNRSRILAAAERLFAERGVHGTSMDAIAAAAGVGKGTLFRRFGDRASLVFALLDETDRALQEAILRGPPPLGPGAPPDQRLIAFGAAMLDRLECDGGLLIEIDAAGRGGWQRSQPYAALWLHVRALLEQARPGGEGDYLADVLLATLSPATVHHQRRIRGLSLEELKRGFAALVTALAAPAG